MNSLQYSCDPEIAPSHPGITALFLFDYDCVESPEGYSVFRSIRTCLERSQGVCAFNDTGLLSTKVLVKFADNAVCTKTVEGGVVGTRRYRSITPSVAAMWTDRSENVELFHDYLNRHTVPGYQGAVLLEEDVSYEAFRGFCARWSRSATEARSGHLRRIIGAGLDACHGFVESWQLLYAKTRSRYAESHFERVGASMGVLLSLALLVFMVTRDDVFTPLDEQTARLGASVTQTASRAAEPTESLGTGVDANTGNNASGRMNVENSPRGGKLDDSMATNPTNERNASSRERHAPFTVQVGSFRNTEFAAGLAQRLEVRGYPAFVSTAKLPNGQTIYRVRVGGFQSRKEASVFGETLKQREPVITGFFVTVNK